MRFDFNPQRFLESEFGRIPPKNRLMLPHPRIAFAHVVAIIAISAARLERDESILEFKDIPSVMREQFIAGNFTFKVVRIANEEREIAKNYGERSQNAPADKAICGERHLSRLTGK